MDDVTLFSGVARARATNASSHREFCSSPPASSALPPRDGPASPQWRTRPEAVSWRVNFASLRVPAFARANICLLNKFKYLGSSELASSNGDDAKADWPAATKPMETSHVVGGTRMRADSGCKPALTSRTGVGEASSASSLSVSTSAMLQCENSLCRKSSVHAIESLSSAASKELPLSSPIRSTPARSHLGAVRSCPIGQWLEAPLERTKRAASTESPSGLLAAAT
mmetsp:Transcript_91593/g.280286  ORF Transcript_91593/g.280286 Transcript_91593/m.280286 type:complete len:226 (+) Transcript_91593:581-1258(+)